MRRVKEFSRVFGSQQIQNLVPSRQQAIIMRHVRCDETHFPAKNWPDSDDGEDSISNGGTRTARTLDASSDQHASKAPQTSSSIVPQVTNLPDADLNYIPPAQTVRKGNRQLLLNLRRKRMMMKTSQAV